MGGRTAVRTSGRRCVAGKRNSSASQAAWLAGNTLRQNSGSRETPDEGGLVAPPSPMLPSRCRPAEQGKLAVGELIGVAATVQTWSPAHLSLYTPTLASR